MEDNMIMTINDVKKELHIGNDKAYRLFKTKSFPSFRLDGKYLIERENFHKWLADIQKLPDKNYRIT